MSGIQNRVFFPQSALDDWIVEGAVDFHDGELTLSGAGRRFKVTEAVHVLREVSGSADAHNLIGRVKPRTFLEGLGAEILETSMLLGDAAYDVTPGWVGVPVGPFVAFSAPGTSAGGGEAGILVLKNDEELLSEFGSGNR